MKQILARTVLSVGLCLGSASALAAPIVMDFDAGGPDPYGQGGFTWASIFGGPGGGGHMHFDTGFGATFGLLNHGGGCCSNPYQLSKDDAGAFTLSSLWVESSDNAMEFIGSNSVTETIPGGFTGMWMFAGLTNVTSVVWNMQNDSGSGVIDNVTLNGAVPEPSTLALLGIAMLAGAGVRRRENAV